MQIGFHRLSLCNMISYQHATLLITCSCKLIMFCPLCCKFFNWRYCQRDYSFLQFQIVLTALSNPKVSSIRKKMIAHPVDPGSAAIASGYTTNTNPGPTTYHIKVRGQWAYIIINNKLFVICLWTYFRWSTWRYHKPTHPKPLPIPTPTMHH